jgi:cyclopropane fatty-acyl-phospholipid synthase-like methyltransferase
MTDMRGVNNYWNQLTDEEIEAGAYRSKVGGSGKLWEEIGLLQFNYLVRNGLKPTHTLLDIGCGALRGGIHFISYLDASNYYGTDINASLLRAAEIEVQKANLSNKHPHLVLDEDFNFAKYVDQVDYALAISLFTHLNMNLIMHCLASLHGLLRAGSSCYATFFEASENVDLNNVKHHWEVTTHFDRDPYHHSRYMLEWIGEQCGYHFEYVGAWGHPRNQCMGKFIRLP